MKKVITFKELTEIKESKIQILKDVLNALVALRGGNTRDSMDDIKSGYIENDTRHTVKLLVLEYKKYDAEIKEIENYKVEVEFND